MVLLFGFVLETGFHYVVLEVLELTTYTRLVSEIHVPLSPRAGIKGTCYLAYFNIFLRYREIIMAAMGSENATPIKD